MSFKKGIKNFSSNLTIIVNTLLLTFVYILGVGSTSVVSKIFKKNFLDIRKKKDSYWTEITLKKKKMEEYYRQF